jgi:hypothetical protein
MFYTAAYDGNSKAKGASGFDTELGNTRQNDGNV